MSVDVVIRQRPGDQFLRRLRRAPLSKRFPSVVPDWCRRPEFIVLLLVGAALRLVLLGHASFLGDQAELLALGRSALAHGAPPITGIRSSIDTMNPPISIYLLLPFALLGDPLWATLATALANIAALVVLYAIANRYAGRWAAFAVGLLYATAAWPVWFSRFIWQQNLLAPVLLLFFWTVCRGLIDHWRGWLGWNVLLWCIAVQLHPSAAPLLALTGLGMFLTWHTLRLRDVIGAWLMLLIFFLPTLLWEVVSHGSDITLYRHYAALPASLDTAAPETLRAVLSPAAPGIFGPGTLYAHLYGVIAWEPWVLVPLYALSILWGGCALIAHALAGSHRLHDALVPRLPRRMRAWAPIGPWLRIGPDWRYVALLALWQVAPLLLMLKHAKPIHEHYLLVVLPALFLQMGSFLAWLLLLLASAPALKMSALKVKWSRARNPARAVSPVPARRDTGHRLDVIVRKHLPRAGRSLDRRLLPAFVTATVLLLASAQTFGTVVQFATISGGPYDDGSQGHTTTRYGIPLDTQRMALQTATAAADARGARVYVAATRREEESFGYLATLAPHPASVYDAEHCLLAPSAGSPAAIVLTTSSVAADGFLRRLRGDSLPKTLPTQPADPLRLYTVPAGTRLPGEIAVANPSGTTQPHLAGYIIDKAKNGPQRLVLHWTGTPRPTGDGSDELAYWYGATPAPSASEMASYTFQAQPIDAKGHPLAAPTATTCPTMAWSRGDDVFTWLPLPDGLTSRAHAGQSVRWRIEVRSQTLEVSRPQLGPLPLETGNVFYASPHSLVHATFITTKMP